MHKVKPVLFTIRVKSFQGDRGYKQNINQLWNQKQQQKTKKIAVPPREENKNTQQKCTYNIYNNVSHVDPFACCVKSARCYLANYLNRVYNFFKVWPEGINPHHLVLEDFQVGFHLQMCQKEPLTHCH